MFEVVFLGTSASAPSVQRGLSSALVLANEHRFMIDCGEGTQRQLLRTGLGFRRLDKILLTHGHLDHILGLGGLASTLGRWEALEELNIYGGAVTLARVQLLMEVVFGPGQIVGSGVTLNLLEPGVLFEDKHFTLTVIPVQHRGPDCFAFLFEERPRRPFLAERAEALGIPQGPVRRELAQGRPAALPDGRVIQPDEVLGPPQRGAKLFFVGDVSHTGPLHKPAEQADLLVIEATYLEVDKQLARQHGHITAAGAAKLARNAGVRQLVLHHVSRRYTTQQILEEAQAIFPNTLVANDFDCFSVHKDKPIALRSLRQK
ncbi:MAG: ribonuclease Z [Caldilinea sp.]|nr:ribonuclease Z [Caldilinea sp.]MDW8442831.1 ribonuclease Z [Caldilineaceae bacterium]